MTHEQAGESVRDVVQRFMQEELSYGLGDGLGPQTDLIEEGIIDSMSLLRLVSFLEERFQIEVKDEDLVPDNFRTLATVDAFVSRCRKVSG